jgi:hypothetical protein
VTHQILQSVLTPVVKLWLRRKNPQALIKASLGEDPASQRILVPGFRVWPSDVDYNLHKSNSTYAADMDVARSSVSSRLTLRGSLSDYQLINGVFLPAGGHRSFRTVLSLRWNLARSR